MRKMPVGPGVRGRSRLLLLVGLTALALALSGCLAKTGTYAPVDWAYEMHYSPSYRAQESPRLTSPDGAVPYKSASDSREYTREIVYTEAEYAAMKNPVLRTDEGLARGAEVYRVNCSFCHGLKGEGPKPDLTDVGSKLGAPAMMMEQTKARPPGELFRIVSQGGMAKTLAGMPRWSTLLSVEDRWLVVDYVMLLQGR